MLLMFTDACVITDWSESIVGEGSTGVAPQELRKGESG